jgi:hypothetical protein
MSVATYKLITTKEMRNKMEKVVCVFCESVYEADTVICSECNDYKGMMTLTAASKEYDFLEYLLEE